MASSAFLLFAVLGFVLATALGSISNLGEVKELSQANNRLALDLHKALSSRENGNIFVSPLSISTALAMLMYGTRGSTAEEMYRILGYDETSLSTNGVHKAFQRYLKDVSRGNEEYALYIANAVLAQNDFDINTQYKEDLQKLYLANVREVDFEKEGPKVVEEINQWVSKATRNKITEFLSELDPATVLVLLNAVYFKGTWKTEFDPEVTFPGNFYNFGRENSVVQVPKMRSRSEFPYVKLGGVKAIELPYKGEHISMVILLPDDKEGLPKLEKALQPNLVRDVRRLMKSTEVELSLPKFKLEYEAGLKEVLQEIGLKKVFQDDADLTGISSASNLQVTKVAHKAVIEVNEEGSEAAGVTGIVIETRMGYFGEVFNVEHPFLFAIVDKRSDMIYFQGRVNQL